MITKIVLKNWQKHKFLSLDLGKITCIVGKNDVGKSSVLRALRFVLLNQPPRGRYVTFGRVACSVAVVAQNGRKIQRKKAPGRNLYLLDGKRYSAVGRTVPDDIRHLLGVGETNFQRQLDLPFWFTETAGQVGRNLNSVVNLDVIDKTLASLATKLRSARSSVDESQQRVLELEAREKELAWVEQCAKDCTRLQVVSDRLDTVQLKQRQIDALVEAGGRAVLTRDRAVAAEATLRDVVLCGQKVGAIHQQRLALDQLAKELESAQDRLQQPSSNLDPVLRVRASGDHIAERRRSLELLIEGLEQGEKQCHQAKQSLRQSSRTLRRKMKGRCPTCGQRKGRDGNG